MWGWHTVENVLRGKCAIGGMITPAQEKKNYQHLLIEIYKFVARSNNVQTFCKISGINQINKFL